MECEEIEEMVKKVLVPYPELRYSVAIDPIYFQVKISIMNTRTRKRAEHLASLSQSEIEIASFLIAAVKELTQE